MSKDEVMSNALLNRVVSLMLRIGTLVTGLAVIFGGILYVKQDKLLVSQSLSSSYLFLWGW